MPVLPIPHIVLFTVAAVVVVMFLMLVGRMLRA
jgi:hypothetical protein